MTAARALSPILAALLAGCTVGADYVRPEVAVPAKWSAVDEAAPAAENIGWWKTFDDPVLDRLVAAALASNLDLRAARSRVREARAEVVIAGAAQAPSVAVSGSVTRGENSANVVQRSSAGTVFSTGGVVYDLYKAGFDAQWELDLFGGVRRSVEAAKASAEAVEEDGRWVLVSLLGEVARNYIDARAAQRQLGIAGQNVESQQETLDLVRSRYRAGLSSDLDVARAEAQLAATAAQMPAFEISAQRAIHRLGVLLGREPGAIAADMARQAPVPAAKQPVAAGVPSDLLRRRPDIRRAERQLAAATALTGAAVADLFPRFNLAAMIGLQSSNANKFFDSGSRAWTLVPGVSLPLFNAGRIRANVEVREAEQEQALARYEATVLTALEEVESALVAHSREQRRRDTLLQSVESSRRAEGLAWERYGKGLTSFLDVLEAERVLHAAESQLAISEAGVAANVVALYKALGGGWQGVEADEGNRK